MIGLVFFYAVEFLEQLLIPWHVSHRVREDPPRCEASNRCQFRSSKRRRRHHERHENHPVLIAAAMSAALVAPAAAQTKFPFRLNWTLYGEHAPFFVARDKGFYKEEGLDVEIQEGSGSTTVAQLVANSTSRWRTSMRRP